MWVRQPAHRFVQTPRPYLPRDAASLGEQAIQRRPRHFELLPKSLRVEVGLAKPPFDQAHGLRAKHWR